MSYIMLLHSDTDQDHREHSARPKENQEAVAVGQGAKCRGLCMSFYPQQSCAVWRILNLVKYRFSSPGAIDELREMWYSFLWREDVAAPVVRRYARCGVLVFR
jgi:hypothetical protein